MHIRVCKYIIYTADLLHVSATHIAIFKELRYKRWLYKWPKHVGRTLSRRNSPKWTGTPHYRGFTITHRHTTLGRNPLEEWSAWCRDLYLKTHSTDNRQTSTPRRDSNPQSQHSSGRTPTPYNARPLGWPCSRHIIFIKYLHSFLYICWLHCHIKLLNDWSWIIENCSVNIC
jgi:hypothetical protein